MVFQQEKETNEHHQIKASNAASTTTYPLAKPTLAIFIIRGTRKGKGLSVVSMIWRVLRIVNKVSSIRIMIFGELGKWILAI